MGLIMAYYLGLYGILKVLSKSTDHPSMRWSAWKHVVGIDCNAEPPSPTTQRLTPWTHTWQIAPRRASYRWIWSSQSGLSFRNWNLPAKFQIPYYVLYIPTVVTSTQYVPYIFTVVTQTTCVLQISIVAIFIKFLSSNPEIWSGDGLPKGLGCPGYFWRGLGLL